MTSLPPHYHDDHEALEDHLREEHAIFAASEADSETVAGSGTPRAHLCCTDYQDGPALKSALEAAAGGKDFVRTALNSNAGSGGGYCAVAHVSSAVAARADAGAVGVSCSPLTHASKEPLSLLTPASSELLSSRAGAPAVAQFGLRLGPGVQDGPSRGLVVTLSPGSLPLDAAASERKMNTRGGSGGGNRSLASPSASSSAALEKRWRASWGGHRGSEGARVLARTVPWTGSRQRTPDGRPDPPGGSGGGDDENDDRRLLLSGGGSVSRARKFHGQKVAGYKAALEHLGGKMETGGAGGHGAATLAETCGWDSNLAIVHGHDDLLYLRCASEPCFSEACFCTGTRVGHVARVDITFVMSRRIWWCGLWNCVVKQIFHIRLWNWVVWIVELGGETDIPYSTDPSPALVPVRAWSQIAVT